MAAAPDLSSTPLTDLISLGGRTAVITGAGAGIGRAVALRLSEAGANILVADIDEKRGQQTVRDIAGRGGKAAYARTDTADPDSITAAGAAAIDTFGGLDIWVNVAGIYPVQPALEMTAAQWQRVIDINLSGVFFGAQAAARAMTAAGHGGVIVNFHSTTAYKVPAPGLAHYIASKGGVEALTRALAQEFGPSGIRVLAVSPTMTGTDGMLEQKPDLTHAFGDIGDPWILYGSRLPLGRIAMPDDVARIVLLAVSDLASFMTGSVLLADGGDAVL